MAPPTIYPDLNAVLDELVASVPVILAENLDPELVERTLAFVDHVLSR